MTEKTYDLNGILYRQRPISFGQSEDINCAIAERVSGKVSYAEALAALTADMTWLIAVVLVPADKTVLEWRRTMPLSVWHDKLKYDLLTEEITEKVVEDFFTCNPAASVSGLMNKALGKVGKVLKQSETSSASSPAAMSQNETTSTGTTP